MNKKERAARRLAEQENQEQEQTPENQGSEVPEGWKAIEAGTEIVDGLIAETTVETTVIQEQAPETQTQIAPPESLAVALALTIGVERVRIAGVDYAAKYKKNAAGEFATPEIAAMSDYDRYCKVYQDRQADRAKLGDFGVPAHLISEITTRLGKMAGEYAKWPDVAGLTVSEVLWQASARLKEIVDGLDALPVGSKLPESAKPVRVQGTRMPKSSAKLAVGSVVVLSEIGWSDMELVEQIAESTAEAKGVKFMVTEIKPSGIIKCRREDDTRTPPKGYSFPPAALKNP